MPHRHVLLDIFPDPAAAPTGSATSTDVWATPAPRCGPGGAPEPSGPTRRRLLALAASSLESGALPETLAAEADALTATSSKAGPRVVGGHSTCYYSFVDTLLAEVARESDAAVRQARNELVRAVRQASAAGMSQAQIAEGIGRSQPEVSRLLRFHGTTPLARRLRAARGEVLRLMGAAGGNHVRVFGSVARGEDDEGSDVDLLFAMDRPLSLMELGQLEEQVSAAVGVSVDLVPEGSLRPDLRDRALAEAVAL